MDPQPPYDSQAPLAEAEPPRRRISRRATLIGSLIAILRGRRPGLAGLGPDPSASAGRG